MLLDSTAEDHHCGEAFNARNALDKRLGPSHWCVAGPVDRDFCDRVRGHVTPTVAVAAASLSPVRVNRGFHRPDTRSGPGPVVDAGPPVTGGDPPPHPVPEGPVCADRE